MEERYGGYGFCWACGEPTASKDGYCSEECKNNKSVSNDINVITISQEEVELRKKIEHYNPNEKDFGLIWNNNLSHNDKVINYLKMLLTKPETTLEEFRAVIRQFK